MSLDRISRPFAARTVRLNHQYISQPNEAP